MDSLPDANVFPVRHALYQFSVAANPPHTTYQVDVSDSFIPFSNGAYEVSTTTTVTLTDSNGNRVCDTP